MHPFSSIQRASLKDGEAAPVKQKNGVTSTQNNILQRQQAFHAILGPIMDESRRPPTQLL